MPDHANVNLAIEHVDCPICGPGPVTLWMDDGKPTRYVRCCTCGTVYASPRSAGSVRYQWLDSTFGVSDGAFENAASRLPALATEASIIQQYVPGGALLEIGCDLGHFFQWFPDPAWQRFGVELSPSAAAYAAQTFSARVFAGTIHQANYPAAFFDLVTMIDVLYYVDDPCADLNEIARVLKPGGWLAIEISGQSYQLLRSRGLVCWLLDHRWTRLHTDSSYLFWFGPSGLQQLLEKNGFQVAGWHVVASPERRASILNTLSALYFAAMSGAVKRSLRVLTLAPKYLCLARPR
jgi:SAM-dependent methyltransferase